MSTHSASRRFIAVTRALLLLCLAVSGVALACGSATPTSPPVASLDAVPPAVPCEALARADISQAVGAPTHITSARSLPDALPAGYCQVLGYVEPAIHFEVRLPLTSWTQRYVQTGCGGLCGQLDIRLGNDRGCYPAEHGEFALASTDMGHAGGMDGAFGATDYRLRIDFAYRGVHLTALAAKALIRSFYGRAPRYSYFAGCSDGGREALMEAQRYPGDFNGITAGAPAMNFTTQNTFYHGWNALRNTGPDGKPILTSDQLPLLHRAALAACDAADGVRDGIISDPFSCRFDPGVIECAPGSPSTTCLTHAQVEAAREIYRGAHDAAVERYVLGGPLPGSELAWEGVYVPQPGNPRIMSSMIATGTLKYLVSERNPPPGYTLGDLQFTRQSFAAVTQLHGVYDATDPDLAPFAKGGGKLILWHGLADPHISPRNTVAYYNAMTRVMGSAAVESFARLYLFPGGYHCGGGEGPFSFDLMSTIMSWVERNDAPFAILASRQPGPPAEEVPGAPPGAPEGVPPPPATGAPNGSPVGPPTAPQMGPPSGSTKSSSAMQSQATSSPDLVRPVYPYPISAQYDGHGNPDGPASFHPGPAKPVAPEQLVWLGSNFYKPHEELWCDPEGTSMHCSPDPTPAPKN